jgi:hypothetical protein
LSRAWFTLIVVAAGCTVPPRSTCPIGTRQYFVVLTRVAVDGGCGQALSGMTAEAMFSTDAVSWRAGRLDALSRGDDVRAPVDSSNDCRFPDAGCSTCVADGGPTANVCEVRLEPVPRTGVDPAGFAVIAALRAENSRCVAIETVRYEATFPAQTTRLSSGGELRQDALPVALRWVNLAFGSPPTNDGATFSALLERQEGTCYETYRATGLAPFVQCETDADCTSTKAVAVIGSRWVVGRLGNDGGIAVTDAGAASVAGGSAVTVDGGLRWPDGFTVGLDGQGRLLTSDGGLVGASLVPGPPFPASSRAACDTDRHACVVGP